MDIYIEYIFLDNLVIDYLILYYTNKILALKGNKLLLLCGGILGAICSVVFPLIEVVLFVSLLLKFSLSCVLVLFLGKIKNIRGFINRLLVFYMLTFALGGVSFALLQLLNAKIYSGILAYDAALPLGILLIALFIYIKMIEYIARVVYKKRNIMPFIRQIILVISNRQVKMTAFLDSGNGLIEKKTGLPIVIISLSSLMRVYKLKDIQKAIETGKSEVLKNIRFINYSTIAGSSKKMLVFDADEMLIYENEKLIHVKNFALGLTMHDFKAKEEYELLLNPAML